jgi:hypothetical protein
MEKSPYCFKGSQVQILSARPTHNRPITGINPGGGAVFCRQAARVKCNQFRNRRAVSRPETAGFSRSMRFGPAQSRRRHYLGDKLKRPLTWAAPGLRDGAVIPGAEGPTYVSAFDTGTPWRWVSRAPPKGSRTGW